MSSETYVTGLAGCHNAEQKRIAVGARARRYAAMLTRPGHVEALVEIQSDGRLKVISARMHPQTAVSEEIGPKLEAYLN